jgi:hypothetical protein
MNLGEGMRDLTAEDIVRSVIVFLGCAARRPRSTQLHVMTRSSAPVGSWER